MRTRVTGGGDIVIEAAGSHEALSDGLNIPKEEIPEAFSSGFIKDRRDEYMKGVVLFE